MRSVRSLPRSVRHGFRRSGPRPGYPQAADASAGPAGLVIPRRRFSKDCPLRAVPTKGYGFFIVPIISSHHPCDLIEGYQRIKKLRPKCAQQYRKLSKDIKIYRNQGGRKNDRSTGENPNFLRLRFFPCFLHTVEVRGLSPLSFTPHSEIVW